MAKMTYDLNDQFVDNSKNTNIYIACFTTSHARLMLYDKLHYLNETVLYYDTHSIIYKMDGTKTIQTGDMLGELAMNFQVKVYCHSFHQALNLTALSTETTNKKALLRVSLKP